AQFHSERSPSSTTGFAALGTRSVPFVKVVDASEHAGDVEPSRVAASPLVPPSSALLVDPSPSTSASSLLALALESIPVLELAPPPSVASLAALLVGRTLTPQAVNTVAIMKSDACCLRATKHCPASPKCAQRHCQPGG